VRKEAQVSFEATSQVNKSKTKKTGIVFGLILCIYSIAENNFKMPVPK